MNKKYLMNNEHQVLLHGRKGISFAEYEKFCSFEIPVDGSNFEFPKYCNNGYRIKSLEQHQRVYEKVV